LRTENVADVTDRSFGMRRTEVRSAHGNSHLGHVLADGSASEGGLRYCINSVALRFVPYGEFAIEGHGEFTGLFEDSATERTAQWQR
jgi:peptide-methionine (R)-S-oxide reductase